MRIVQEKLERFSELVMSDVTAQKDTLLDSAIEGYQKEYDRKESEFLENAYKTIQTGLKMIDKEKQEIISRAIMENQTKRLHKRTEVVQRVFDLAVTKLRDFTKSDDYEAYLIQMIEDCLAEMGTNEAEIIINKEDAHLLPVLNKKFNNQVRLESQNVDMIGGCRILNAAKGYFIDDSFAKRLGDQRNDFMQSCHIKIDSQE